jgi:hypothetical protein
MNNKLQRDFLLYLTSCGEDLRLIGIFGMIPAPTAQRARSTRASSQIGSADS